MRNFLAIQNFCHVILSWEMEECRQWFQVEPIRNNHTRLMQEKIWNVSLYWWNLYQAWLTVFLNLKCFLLASSTRFQQWKFLSVSRLLRECISSDRDVNSAQSQICRSISEVKWPIQGCNIAKPEQNSIWEFGSWKHVEAAPLGDIIASEHPTDRDFNEEVERNINWHSTSALIKTSMQILSICKFLKEHTFWQPWITSSVTEGRLPIQCCNVAKTEQCLMVRA